MTRLGLLLDKYLCSQLIVIIVFAIFLFSLIWLAPDTLFKLTQYLSSGEITVSQALVMFAFHLPPVLQQTIPVAVLLGSIFLFQRLSQNYEVVALLASGVSPLRIFRSVLWVGLLFGLLHGFVDEWLIPQTANRLERMYTDLGLKELPDRNFLFVEKNHQHQLSKFFMIGQIQKPELSDFIILYYQETPNQGLQISRILRAKTGRWLHDSHQWKLVNGIEYILDDDGVYKNVRQFQEQQIRTDPFAARLLDDNIRLSPMSMSWKSLSQYIRLLKQGGQWQDVPFFEVRLWQKVSQPFATVIFSVLGALLGMERIRTNRLYGLTFGALIIFIYSILVPFSGSFGALDIIAPAFVAWIPLLAALAMAALLQALRPRSG